MATAKLCNMSAFQPMLTRGPPSHVHLSWLFALFACGTSSGTETGNGTTGTTGGSTGMEPCPPGTLDCPCAAGGQCGEDFSCVNGICQAATCGDGVVQQGEECDAGDGNADDGNCKTDCSKQVCGDGVVGPGEGCDDGNTNDDDGCSSTCKLASCGDGTVDPGEACDDGNTIDEDQCTNNCTLPACGDGIVQAGEDCDDGNADNSDACLSSCDVATCGDGFVWTGVEACDDGNSDDSDLCLSDCTLATCGDGIVQTGEDCDEGTNNADDSACKANCLANICGDGALHMGVEECDDGNMDPTDSCTSDCKNAICGDGFVHDGVEACDDGNMDPTDSCTTECKDAVCGDGFVQAGVEACDAGAAKNMVADGCTVDCLPPPTGVTLTGAIAYINAYGNAYNANQGEGVDPLENYPPLPLRGFQALTFDTSPFVINHHRAMATNIDVTFPGGAPALVHGADVTTNPPFPDRGPGPGPATMYFPQTSNIACPDDQWLVGLTTYSGDYFDGIQLHCAPLNVQISGDQYTVTTGQLTVLDSQGNTNPNLFKSDLLCAPGTVVGKLITSGDGRHTRIGVSCHTPTLIYN
ncbi:MAG: DUF4215 domain-containing protein [Deltaproteobacteria bacterium]|nr:MAG: DUF4215 domain-containing protein [Deltaproteobacteria bacterium]